MKKLIITLLFILLSCPSFAETQLAWMGPVIAGSSGTYSCNASEVSSDGNTTGASANLNLANATIYRIAGKWTTSETGYRCTATVKLIKGGNPSGNIFLRIYSDSSSTPGDILATSGTIAASSVNTSSATYSFTFSSPVYLETSTSYWLSIETDTLNDNSNYIKPYYNQSTGSGVSYYDTSWHSIGSYDLYRQLYK